MASAELGMVVELLRSMRLMGDADVATLRANMEAATSSAGIPGDVRVEAVDADGVPGEWVRAGAVADDTCVLYFHGGGYCIGSPATHRALVASISRAAGLPVLSVDYRLAPENPYPAAVDDGVRAYQHLRNTGFPASRIGVAGDSAGGGLTVATLLALRDAGAALPAAAACISPWLDLTMSGASIETKADEDPMLDAATLERMAAAYAGPADRRAAGISPLFADLQGLPEILVHVGTAELLLDDALRFVAALRKAGVEVSLDAYDDMIHVWHAFAAILPEGREAIERIGAFFRRRLSD